jgi:hypothetical protein
LEEWWKPETSHPCKKTYRRHEKYQLVERLTHPHQATLDGVTRRDLLVILDIVSDLKGRRPWDAGEIEDLAVTTSNISR